MQNWKLEKLVPIPGFEQTLPTIFEETIILFHDSLSLSIKMQVTSYCNIEACSYDKQALENLGVVIKKTVPCHFLPCSLNSGLNLCCPTAAGIGVVIFSRGKNGEWKCGISTMAYLVDLHKSSFTMAIQLYCRQQCTNHGQVSAKKHPTKHFKKQ